MAWPAAILIGGAAAIGIPYLLRDAPDPWNGLATLSTVHIAVGAGGVDFSWPIFGVSTLLVWILLRAARSG